jgi:NadR type nicotinamide-nucleotide adenylyltransferase
MSEIIKFVFVGPESTGKTTLCKIMADHYNTNWVSEMCRVFAEEKTPNINPNINAQDIQFGFTLDDFIKMANAQNKEEYNLSKTSNKLLFCDNDSFSLSIWCERYLGEYFNEIYDIYQHAEYLHNEKKVYILTKPNVPFVQDGLRDGEHIRDWMYDRFLEELEKHKMTYYIIDLPNYEERISSVEKIIKKYNIYE